jgi:hypothetical protein
MRTRLRGRFTLLFVVFAVMLAIPAIALADVVKNDVTNDVGVGQIRNYVAGDPATTVGYYIQPAGDCDPANGTAANVSLQVSEFNNASLDAAHTGVVTIAPSSQLSFTQCDVKQQISFSTAASAPNGDYKITATATDSGTGDSYNESPATFVLRVTGGGNGGGEDPPANTPPVVTVTGVANGAQYEFGSVPAAGCSVEDAEDGNSTFAATLSSITGPLSSYGLGSQTASCTYTDAGGLSDSDSFTYDIVDTTPPALNISGAADGTVFNVCGSAPSRPTFDPTDNVAIDEDLSKTYDEFTSNLKPSGVGTWTYYAQAYDVAGNNTSETRTYPVQYGAAFGGFLPPINASGTRSVFKLTSTVPVKFQLMCNGTPISNAVAYLTVQKVDPNPDGSINEAIATDAATTGNQFRYADGTYHFNLSTKIGYTNPSGGAPISFSAGTWRLIVSLDDGTTRSVLIDLRK